VLVNSDPKQQANTMKYRTYTIPGGKVMWRVENAAEFIRLGQYTNIAKSSIVGAAITEPSTTVPPPTLFTSIQGVEVFPTCKDVLQLMIVYEPPLGGERTFMTYSLFPQNAECRELVVDLQEDLRDRLLGVGPAQLVADRLGVGDVHRRLLATQKRMLWVVLGFAIVGVAVFFWWILRSPRLPRARLRRRSTAHRRAAPVRTSLDAREASLHCDACRLSEDSLRSYDPTGDSRRWRC
jgi:hypothetical protein